MIYLFKPEWVQFCRIYSNIRKLCLLTGWIKPGILDNQYIHFMPHR